MPLTPYETWLLYTELPYEEVCGRLDDAIGIPRGINPIAGRSEPYLGIFEKDQFQVTRDSFKLRVGKPVIRGKIKMGEPGSCVHLYMRPGRQADIFIIASALIFLAGFIENLISGLMKHDGLLEILGDSMMLLAGVFLWLALLYFFLTVSIKSESKRSRQFFADIIEAYRVEELVKNPRSDAT